VKNFWFQTHWLIGITAGVVLAVVGVTGGLLSFEDDLLRWMNRGVMTVTPTGEALALPALVERLQAAQPNKRLLSVTVSAEAHESVRAGFVPAAPRSGAGEARAGSPPPRPRTEFFYFDPYTGASLGQPRGQEFFRTVTQLHRYLVAGDVGKQIVGASTVGLLILTLSGLYLRWPRRIGNWRAWLAVNFSHKGRSFLWHLHAAVGTWVLVFYLLAGFTGLYWSYDWYRNGLFALSGAPRPTRDAPPLDAPARGPADLARVWSSFQGASGGYREVTFTLPQKPEQALDVRYLGADPAHDRAFSRLALHPTSGEVLRHDRYDDRALGARLMSSMLSLHSGSYFGVIGTILVMLASLFMPLFAITGWMMYLERRGKKRAAKQAAAASPVKPSVAERAGEMLVAFASQTGTAERLAWQTAGVLQAAGVPVTVQPLARMDEKSLGRFQRALFVVSTFGEGESPDNARGFVQRAMKKAFPLDRLNYGLLALGDRHYDTYCGFGRALDVWLRRQGAQPLFAPVEMDRGCERAQQEWQAQLGTLGVRNVSPWNTADYGRWRLVERRLLNDGSVGQPTYHIALESLDCATWQAGDVLDVQPRHSPAWVAQTLAAWGADGAMPVHANGRTQPLADVLVRGALPPSSDALTLEQRVAGIVPLPAREYSIASIPADGRVHLLVRQSHRPDGTIGVGSGWLTAYAEIGETIEARVRSNSNFHAPMDARPMILIGNGTGLAGLRGHLKARVDAGHRRNWLLFGERQASRDFYYREEIEAWRTSGFIERVDLAFSRDQAERVYVQDRLRAAEETLRAWVADGAAIYVCGSIEGMAPGVEAVLTEFLGSETLEQMIVDGRYRRDVY
jgi:sulfite reductase (NADPH) flavoprotein alpha-component